MKVKVKTIKVMVELTLDVDNQPIDSNDVESYKGIIDEMLNGSGLVGEAIDSNIYIDSFETIGLSNNTEKVEDLVF